MALFGKAIARYTRYCQVMPNYGQMIQDTDAVMQVWKYGSMQICTYAGIQVCRYVSIQVLKYTSIQVYQ